VTLVALTLAGTASAQGLATNRIAAERDWSVFVEDNPVECIATSQAVEEVNTRDGQPVSVERGDSLLYVFWRPAEGVAGQITFTGGYGFAPNSTVTLQVGATAYTLFTEGEYAWAESAAADAQIVAAMRAGSQAILVGVSGRGTRTEDTFSLAGFSAATDAARARCGG
jgi:hypothetical protein